QINPIGAPAERRFRLGDASHAHKQLRHDASSTGALAASRISRSRRLRRRITSLVSGSHQVPRIVTYPSHQAPSAGFTSTFAHSGAFSDSRATRFTHSGG